jgi:hypothetical protein
VVKPSQTFQKGKQPKGEKKKEGAGTNVKASKQKEVKEDLCLYCKLPLLGIFIYMFQWKFDTSRTERVRRTGGPWDLVLAPRGGGERRIWRKW